MQEYAARFAEFLEQLAVKIRSLTIDRISKAIRLAGMGIVVGSLGFSALIFLVWALFEVLEIPLTTGGAFALIGVAILVIGAVMWSKRFK